MSTYHLRLKLIRFGSKCVGGTFVTISIRSGIHFEPLKETHIIIEYGRSVTIPCRVKGNPFPVVDWTSDHMEISRDHSEIIYYNNQGDLKINKADRSLNGEYICHAKNVAGHSMMKINIEVISGKQLLNPHYKI